MEYPDTYPIQPKPHTLEYLREVAHLRSRTNVIGATTRVRHSVAQAIHRFFHEHGFLFWMIEPEIAFADLSDNATLAKALLKYVLEAVLAERGDDMAFFDERIEKGLLAKLQGIVDTEFVRMDYGDAITVLEKAKGKIGRAHV